MESSKIWYRIALAAMTAALPLTALANQEDEEAPNLTPDVTYEADDFAEPGPFVPAPTVALGQSGLVSAPAGRQPTGALSGRIVYMSAGHGWTADQDSGAGSGTWYTQRGDYNEIVEDLQNQDNMTMYAYQCFNAGATVVAMRPIGNQTNEVILDNDDAGVVFTPDISWNNSAAGTYYGDVADVPYRYIAKSSTETATARYTPTIPEEGFYPVYTWVRAGSDRLEDQLYRIVHSGGTTEVRINHRMVGNGWVYLGTYYLEAGTSSYVEISNQSTGTGTYAFADAIRFGNGMGDIDRGGGISGKPREDEACRYWVQAMLGQGAGSSPHDSSSSDQNDNVSASSRMSALMNREVEGDYTDRIFLSFHSNASHGSIGLYNGNNYISSTTPSQERWAELVGRECNDDLVDIGSPPLEGPWLDQGPNPGDVTLDRTDIEFGEINASSYGDDEFDATIIEVAGHNPAGNDPLNLRNPNCRSWIARACVQATIRYFNEFGGGALAFPPEAPTNVRAISDGSGNVTISWDAPVVDGIGGDAATGYVVYRSSNGYGFGNPVTTASTSTTISGLTPKEDVYFRVAATNAGGESLPSETVGASPLASGDSTILIVNGFDRLGRTQNPRETAASGMGGPSGGGETYDRVKPRLSNSFDYVVMPGQALGDLGWPFDSCQNEAIINGDVLLSDYDTVIWLSGEESTADDTFDSTEQTLVTSYLSGGGKIFVSGAEIGWDLEAQGNGTTFYNSTLKTDYVSDDAGTYTIAGGTSIFSGLGSFTFDDGSLYYDSEWPDTIAGTGGSAVCLTYSGGAGAAIQYPTGATNGQIVMLGFPYETITSATVRRDMLEDVLIFFGTAVPVGLSWFGEE